MEKIVEKLRQGKQWFISFVMVRTFLLSSKKRQNYLIMKKEIIQRGLDCKKDYRNIIWYRGEDTKSMLQKLLEKYPTSNALYGEKNNG